MSEIKKKKKETKGNTELKRADGILFSLLRNRDAQLGMVMLTPTEVKRTRETTTAKTSTTNTNTIKLHNLASRLA